MSKFGMLPSACGRIAEKRRYKYVNALAEQRGTARNEGEMMDFGRALGAPTRDPKWLGKIALGVLVMVVPIVNLALVGFGIAYVANVARGRDNELPSWNDFGTHWAKGLGYSVAIVAYYLPAFLIMFLMVIPGALGAGMSPTDEGALLAMLGSAGTGLILALLYVIAVSFLEQAARVNYAISGTFSGAFQVKAILGAVRANLGGYVAAWLMSILTMILMFVVVGAISTLLGSIPCIGWMLGLIFIPIAWGIGIHVGMIINAFFGQYAQTAYGLVAPGGYPAGGPPAGAPAPYPSAPSFSAGGQAIPVAPAAPMAPSQTVPPPPGPPAPPPATRGQELNSTQIKPQNSTLAGQSAVAAAVARAREQEPVASEPTAEEPISEGSSVPEPTASEPSPSGPAPGETSDAKSEQAVVSIAEGKIEPEPKPDPKTGSESEPESRSESLPDPPTAVEAVAPTPPPAPAIPPETTAATQEPPPAAPVAPVPAASPQIALAVRRQSGPGTPGERWIIPRSQVRVGRDDTCYISLDDDKASRSHASLELTDDGLLVRDAGSTNGTLVDGVKVGEQPVIAGPGAVIKIGGTELVVMEN